MSIKNKFIIKLKTIHIFLYALFTKINFALVGQILLSEIFSFLYIIYNINLFKKIKNNIVFKIVIFSLIGLLFFQIVSDVLNSSSFHNYIRGWSVIIFSIISIIALTILLYNNLNYIIIFLLCLSISNIIYSDSDLNFGLIYENTNFFKIKYVPFFNPLALIIYFLLYKNNFNSLRLLFLFIYSILCIYFDARSNGFIFLTTTLFIYLYEKKIKLNTIRIFYITFILYIFFVVYSFLVSERVINGSNSISQFSKMENKYNPFELLYYGRSEIPVLFSSIIDKPLFGHGSWGEDKYGKYSYELSYITKSPRIFFSNYIRAHSILFGYFAYAGLFAFLILLNLFFRLFKYSYNLVISKNVDESIKHIIIFYTILMIWHMLFSPIGTLRYDFVYFSSILISIHLNSIISND